MESADDVDLGRPLREGLPGPVLDLPEVVGVGIRLVGGPGEGAKCAAVHADVGMVDMAVDVEPDPVAVLPPVGRGGQLADLQEFLGTEQKQGLVVADPFATSNLFRYGTE